MNDKNFYSELAKYIQSKDNASANRVVMHELAIILSKDKADFIEVLRNANILIPDNVSDVQLVNAFVENAPNNRKLLLGASFLISHKNQTLSADGESEINDLGVKATYKTMYNYFDAKDYEDVSDKVNADYYDAEGDNAYGGGGFASIMETAGGLAGKVMDSQNAKKFGASNTLAKQQDARAQMQQSLMAQKQQTALSKQADKDRKAKTTKIILIVGGSLLAIGLIVGVIYAIKKKK